MKLCDTCIYRNNVEQLKPCIIYRDDCEHYEKERGDMTKEQSIKWLKDMLKNFDLPQEQYQTALEMAIKALVQESCEDEYIKVPKKAFKYRTTGMVAYNVEWLKNHFDIERAVICGEQEPKTGHWKRNETIRLTYCSECGFGQHIDEFRTYNYCPNCGARMVGEEDVSQ